ncbi:WD repeat protein [Pseudovirgaria hyperparasitica]|uniref:Serine-threonine kinase receptor-associated protein n=1 Tax=Pseudovirgaria hyperparasitica TaxID=470096 RepID=A0A6A6W8F3_9PEZI|nr:WD repeat protein [Pseudovirgaria hyperparasitica]KAF2758933.1 WD repeat protein [Pseudovirgaria hyperparasitica]
MASESTKFVPLTCHGHSRPVPHLSFSSVTDDDQYYIISACKDNNPMLRDGMTGDWIGTFIGHKGAVWQARLSSDASLAATGSADFSARVWDTRTGEALHTLQHNHVVRAVAFPNQPRPQILATGGVEKKLRIFDLSRSASSSPVTANELSSAASTPSYEIGLGVHGGTIKSIVWGNDPNILITACEDKKIRWWDLRSRSTIGEYQVDGVVGTCELDNPTSDAGNSGPGVLSVASGKTAYFFDGAQPAQLIKSVKMPQDVASVALHSGQRKFITGGAGDTWVRIWDFDEEKELETGKGHHGPVWSVGFSPDGKLYATGSEDGTIKLWKFTTGPYGLWR